ncbi:hypothetical protein ACGF0K_27820 [Streptomyces sp. NPDC048156]|uniref:hypothetical protein n=1 Tax=Streptomyces sp. NPDC048156 TaxID=3365502 RepID=UPI0037142EF9
MISTGPLNRTALSRVTVVGERGRVDLVLPGVRRPLDGVYAPVDVVTPRLSVIGVFGVYGRLPGIFA